MDEENNEIVEASVEERVEEREVPKTKTTTEQTSQKTERTENRRQPTLEELVELKQEAIERRKKNKALEGTVSDLTNQISDMQKLLEVQKTEFEATKKLQQDRLVRATLLSKLTKEGCIDPETAMSMLANDVKFDKNGDVSNDGELVEKLKSTKSYFFTGPATTQSQSSPRPVTRPANVKDLDDKEFDNVLRSMGVKIPG